MKYSWCYEFSSVGTLFCICNLTARDTASLEKGIIIINLMTQYCRTWSDKKKNINVCYRGNVKERKLKGKVNEIQKKKNERK